MTSLSRYAMYTGSEKSQLSITPTGEQMAESANINRSLLVLGKYILYVFLVYEVIYVLAYRLHFIVNTLNSRHNIIVRVYNVQATAYQRWVTLKRSMLISPTGTAS